MAKEVLENMEGLVTARQRLKTSIEKSRAFASALDEMGPKLEKINQRLPSLEAAARSISVQKSAVSASKDHIGHALGPASAVLKVFYTARELKMSLVSDPCSDLFNYLLVMKRLEEVLRFLADNCRLAIMWLEGINELVEKDAVVTNEKYLAVVKKSLRILQELQANEERDLLGGGLLGAALEKLGIEFKRLLTERSVPLDLASLATFTVEQASSTIASSSLPLPVMEKLQAIVERLNSNNKLEMCISVYVDARSSNAKRSLQTLGLDYLEMCISKFDDVQRLEGYINQWNKHLVLAVKHLFELEYRLCNDVFKKIGSDVAMGCFAKIAAQSGIHAFLQFGKHVTECKKDPIKLLKLLDMFASLNNLRLDFNLLFSGESCTEIQNSTRDLVKRIVNGACEIFWQLPLQLELQRRTSPPSDGSVPRLVSFITHYCNQLLGDDYNPILTQVLKIHQSWKQENYGEDLISNQVLVIMKEIGLNLDGWSKVYEDISLSYLFMMNNHFHLCNMKGKKLGDMMGDSWLTGHEQYTDYYAELYLRESWGKLLALLNQKSMTTLAGEDPVMERLLAFNEAFDQIYKKQSNRIICDEKLREKVCELLVQAILPVYSSYMQDHHMTFVEQDGAASNYVKYSVQSLEKMFSSMFRPKPSKYNNSTEQRNLMGSVDYRAWKLQNMLSSLFRKHGSSRQAHLRAKIKSFVANQFRLTLTAI
ncbi:exocyst complex component EXO70A1-like [Juglans microcarpa x Juglans regia]|uniref:exocyst complex component EXO70A1-like n=1 Tax=Juglans microcarpa x Juglans regia TaxID=2249226 RepID=UPI001B7DB1D0|nr:exocyst complex component EXO70A1-like [Juglans microcarpa x Juglans regia]